LGKKWPRTSPTSDIIDKNRKLTGNLKRQQLRKFPSTSKQRFYNWGINKIGVPPLYWGINNTGVKKNSEGLEKK
jgi:hypothetical protein